MQALRNTPIERKLIIIIMLTSGLALTLACVAFVVDQLIGLRAEMVKDASITAAMVAESTSAALSFEDAAAAEQTLKSLSADDQITHAAVYDASGKLFAQYHRAGTASFTPPRAEADGHRFEGDHLSLFHAIRLGEEKVGTVFIESSLEEIGEQLRKHGLIGLLVLLGASLAAFLLARKLQQTISGPISHLSEVMGRVAAQKDYSLRARSHGNDELGRLITGFNGMLGQIQAQDNALQEAHDHLERRVEERTNELQKEMAEREQAQAQLENIHRQLLTASRQAGMAEIATNVLHNVGNVLNSVNVSAGLIAENVQRSKAANLSRAAALLREHEHDLGSFLSSDPKGKHIPAYLTQFAEHLLAEQSATVKELESLRGNVDHIKEIVAMQQSYAKVSGVKEIIPVAELLEDSLRMNTGALSRHGVEIVREYEDVPPVNVDKHKVLQILVNLVRNAKYACSESERSHKRVTLRVERVGEMARIKVIDNGVGIPRENMERIFNHGFTTRASGHGFGLHSGALAARELGGSLTAHSDGLGTGATFTLDLPLQVVEMVDA